METILACARSKNRNATQISRCAQFALTSPPARRIGMQGAMLKSGVSLYSDFVLNATDRTRRVKEFAPSLEFVRNTRMEADNA